MKEKTGLSLVWLLKHLDIGRTTYYNWLNWKPREKKGFVHILKPLQWEEESVIGYAKDHYGIGYKKLAYQMLDKGIVSLTPPQVYRILKSRNLLDKLGRVNSFAGKEYKDKPMKPNEHWHTDIMYIKRLEMWCFLIVILDGYSRYVIGWKVMLDMTAQSVSLFMQEVIDNNPCLSVLHKIGDSVKLINDNGSQLISRDFKEVLLSANIQQIRIRRNHPQSNGKVERFNGLVRQECLRPHSPVTLNEVKKVIREYVDYYNNHRLHSAIDYMKPVDYYKGNVFEIQMQREEKLKLARERRVEENRTFNQGLKTQTTSYFKSANCSV